jgi:nitrogenase iron protein NifH
MKEPKPRKGPLPARRERIVIFGKGGIGKSLIASNLSVCFSAMGLKVLHVGCDPKHDSTMSLVHGGRIKTVMELQHQSQYGFSTTGFVVQGLHGICCVEAGGPEPGVGCAGRGIARMLELFDNHKLIEQGGYHVVVFDVLGDVVCGGFAAPLRLGFGEKVVIVVSEEIMSLYAANNIAKSVLTYSANGIFLAGLVANMKNREANRALLKNFARKLGTEILGFLPRDAQAGEAEVHRIPVVDYAPASGISRALRKLAKEILGIKAGDAGLPTPLSDDAFDDWIRREEPCRS